VVLLPGLPFGGSLAIADRVWREVGAAQIVEAGARIACAASIGVASFPGKDVETAGDLLRLARAALARARAEGRGICLVQHHGYLYHPDVQTHVTT
jgi:PleD family two-component response regulator